MKRIAAVALVVLSLSALACHRDNQVATTATDDTMSTGPTTNPPAKPAPTATTPPATRT